MSLDDTLDCRTRFQKYAGKTRQLRGELQDNFHSLTFSGTVEPSGHDALLSSQVIVQVSVT